jgi:hypothetical protein
MYVYEQFKINNLLNLEIDVSALYLIAAPKTPEPVRAEAVKRAAKGERVTHEAVVELRKQFEDTGELPNSEVRIDCIDS